MPQKKLPPPRIPAPTAKEIERAKTDRDARKRVTYQLSRVKQREEEIARWNAENADTGVFNLDDAFVPPPPPFPPPPLSAHDAPDALDAPNANDAHDAHDAHDVLDANDDPCDNDDDARSISYNDDCGDINLVNHNCDMLSRYVRLSLVCDDVLFDATTTDAVFAY